MKNQSKYSNEKMVLSFTYRWVPFVDLRQKCCFQARRKVLKTGGARYTKGIEESEFLGKFLGVSPKKQGVYVHPRHPPFRFYTPSLQSNHFYRGFIFRFSHRFE